MTTRAADRHAQSIKTSSFLSKRPMLGREQKEDVVRLVPEEVSPSLEAAGIDHVLVGAHGLSGWLPQARATEDVDFLIRVKDRQKAAEVILKKFPDLKLERHLDVWRFKRGADTLIDLMLNRSALYKRVFTEFVTIKIGRRQMKVPKLEAALAMKFAAMTGHYRDPDKKHYDAGDFIGMVRKNAAIDLVLLHELGALQYPGGGADVVKYVETVRAGRKFDI